MKLEGLYLVVSPILSFDKLLLATEKALDGGVDILQFSPIQENMEMNSFAVRLVELAREHGVPFLINNSLQLAEEVGADGLHFDNYEISPKQARQMLGRECAVGYTVGVDANRLRWTQEAGADYVSFCSVFKPSTPNQCPIVPLEAIRTARSRISLPIFAAGGINLHNAHLVLEAGADGIVVTSALLKAEDAEKTAATFKEIICNHRGISTERRASTLQ